MKITQDVRDYAATRRGSRPTRRSRRGCARRRPPFASRGKRCTSATRPRAGSDRAVIEARDAPDPVRRRLRGRRDRRLRWMYDRETMRGPRWRSNRPSSTRALRARCHGTDGRGDAEIRKTMPNVRDFHDPAFRARAYSDTIVSIVMAGQGADAGVRQAASACPRCRRSPVTFGGSVPTAPPREALLDEGGAGGDCARRRLLLPTASGSAFAKSRKHKHREHKSHHHHQPRQHEAEGPDEEGKAHLKRANALADEGDCQAAIDEYTKAYELLERSGRAVQSRRMFPPHR